MYKQNQCNKFSFNSFIYFWQDEKHEAAVKQEATKPKLLYESKKKKKNYAYHQFQ